MIGSRLERNVLLLLVLAGPVLAGPAHDQWSEVTPGITYRQMTLPGPNRAYIVRADRRKDNWTIDTMTSMGTVKGGRETVPDMARRCDDAVTLDGRRYEVKVAINGDYFNPRTGYAAGGQIISGWFVLRFGEYSGGSGFVWTTDRRCNMGGNVQNGERLQRAIFADGTEMAINGLNSERPSDGLTLYTPHYDSTTGTDNQSSEVLIRVSEPVGIMPKPPGVKGEILRVGRSTGSTAMPFDCVVLSARGPAAADLLKHAKVGQTLHLCLELKDFGNEDTGLKPADWHNAWSSMGGPKNIVINGRVPRDWEKKAARYAAEGKPHGSVLKAPRTIIAYDKDYLFFAVIDGRMEQSVGMTFTEAGEFCVNELKVDQAVLQDGGGSSTLWLDGKVVNIPSDRGKDGKPGVIRPVANGWLIALVHPPKFSRAFEPGGQITTKADLELKLGPGIHYGAAGKVASGTAGQIAPHAIDGVYAKGTHWWLCTFGEAQGWAPEGPLGLPR